MAQEEETSQATPGADVAVSAVDVTKRYGTGGAAVDALRGVSVDFPRGQFAAVMGPSGSGKSTFMNIMAGLDKPTSGSVFIDGTDITKLKDKPLTLLRREKVGLRLPVLQPAPHAHRRGEPRAAVGHRRAQGRPRVGDGAGERRGPRRSAQAPSVGALRAASSSAWPWPAG